MLNCEIIFLSGHLVCLMVKITACGRRILKIAYLFYNVVKDWDKHIIPLKSLTSFLCSLSVLICRNIFTVKLCLSNFKITL